MNMEEQRLSTSPSYNPSKWNRSVDLLLTTFPGCELEAEAKYGMFLPKRKHERGRAFYTLGIVSNNRKEAKNEICVYEHSKINKMYYMITFDNLL